MIRALGLLLVLPLLGGCIASGGGLALVSGADPVYPDPAWEQRIEGYVVLEYRVDEDGMVRDLAVVEASPPGVFDAAALAAVASWRYRPMVAEGRAVSVEGVRSRLDFRIGEAWKDY